MENEPGNRPSCEALCTQLALEVQVAQPMLQALARVAEIEVGGDKFIKGEDAKGDGITEGCPPESQQEPGNSL